MKKFAIGSPRDLAAHIQVRDSQRLAHARTQTEQRTIEYPLGSGEAEEVALSSGIKPLIRQRLTSDQVTETQTRFEKLGLSTQVLEIADGALLFASRDGARVRQAVQCERVPGGDRELGLLLGYPVCCVDAFLALSPPRATLDAHRSAFSKTHKTFSLRLNTLDLALFHYVPWHPCSFECEPSETYANAIANLIATQHGQSLEATREAGSTCPPGCKHERFVRDIDRALGAHRLLMFGDVQISMTGAYDGHELRVEEVWSTTRDAHPSYQQDPDAKEATARLVASIETGQTISLRDKMLCVDGVAIAETADAMFVPFGARRSVTGVAANSNITEISREKSTDLPLSEEAIRKDVLEPLLGTLIHHATALRGHTLESTKVGAAIELSFRRSAEKLDVWIVPRAKARAFFSATRRFALGYNGATPSADGVELLRTIERVIRQSENAIDDQAFRRWVLCEGTARLFSDIAPLEWMAVKAGIKPAARRLVGSSALDKLVDQARKLGLKTAQLSAPTWIERFGTERPVGKDMFLYVARSDDDAQRAMTIERAMIDEGRQRPDLVLRYTRDLGNALGYPPCCVEYFVSRRNLTNAEIRFWPLWKSNTSLPAVLNHFDFTSALISHFTCSYDCIRSHRLATQLLEAISLEDASFSRELHSSLRGAMLAFRNGTVIRLKQSTKISDHEVRFVGFEERTQGSKHEHWLHALKRSNRLALVGGSAVFYQDASEVERFGLADAQVVLRHFE